MIFLYRVLTNILYPFLFFFLFIRILKKKEDIKRFKEKILVNHFNVKRSGDSRLLWFHAASIGEFKSIVPIIKQLKLKNKVYEFLITTNTLSSSQLASAELKKLKYVKHRFMPFDVNFLLEQFLNSWKPEKIFLVDSEIWPNLILKAKNKKIPIALINARLTKKTFNRWLIFPETAKKIFGSFDLCLCSNKETKIFLKKFNVKNIKYEGNIKLINQINFKNLFKNNNLKLSRSRFWVAASTHKEEDIFCLKTHLELKKIYSNILTIIAPRHLDRVKNLKRLSNNLNFKTQILNSNNKISKKAEVIIINSFGVLQKYFLFAKSVFIGKSIIKKLKYDSGQNPIDAAKLGCKIYHGPYVSNFREIYKFLNNNKLTVKIKNYTQLSRHLIKDLKKPEKKIKKYVGVMQMMEKKILFQTMKHLQIFLSNETK